MTEYMASSAEVGRRPRISRMLSYSSSLRPSSLHGWVASASVAAASTVSTPTGGRAPVFPHDLSHAATRFRTEVKNASPSVDGPNPSSTACSGWGIRPTTLPRSLVMPAMSR